MLHLHSVLVEVPRRGIFNELVGGVLFWVTDTIHATAAQLKSRCGALNELVRCGVSWITNAIHATVKYNYIILALGSGINLS